MTYSPHHNQAVTPIDEALAILESQMDKFGIHTVYEGRNIVGGVDQGPAVVAVVAEKGMRAQSQCIPPVIVTPSGHSIPTDVVEAPPPVDLRLRLPIADYTPRAQNDHQRCHDCMIPGGVQIAPAGAQWVGTLSC